MKYWHIKLFAPKKIRQNVLFDEKPKKRAEFSIDAKITNPANLIEILEGFQVWSGFKMEIKEKPLKEHYVTDYSIYQGKTDSRGKPRRSILATVNLEKKGGKKQ